MELSGLIALAMILAFLFVVLAAWLWKLISRPVARHRDNTDLSWHPMLVSHGNLYESRDRL